MQRYEDSLIARWAAMLYLPCPLYYRKLVMPMLTEVASQQEATLSLMNQVLGSNLRFKSYFNVVVVG